MTAQSLESERDFYFVKLVDMEHLCTKNEEAGPIVAKVLDVMYATQVRVKHT